MSQIDTYIQEIDMYIYTHGYTTSKRDIPHSHSPPLTHIYNKYTYAQTHMDTQLQRETYRIHNVPGSCINTYMHKNAYIHTYIYTVHTVHSYIHRHTCIHTHTRTTFKSSQTAA
jgi:hypothetical protein